MTPQGATVYRGISPLQRAPAYARPGLQGQRAPLYARPGAQTRFGAHYPRYRAPGTRFYGARGPHVAAQFTRRPGVTGRSGAHYPRYRHRRRGYGYYYGGWWYASPWWTYGGYYGESCTYWADECASQWGWNTESYYACLRYYGCY